MTLNTFSEETPLRVFFEVNLDLTEDSALPDETMEVESLDKALTFFYSKKNQKPDARDNDGVYAGNKI